MSEIQLAKQIRFEDILFSNTLVVVENQVETKVSHVTTLTVDNKVAAIRTITAGGTNFEFF